MLFFDSMAKLGHSNGLINSAISLIDKGGSAFCKLKQVFWPYLENSPSKSLEIHKRIRIISTNTDTGTLETNIHFFEIIT